MSPLVMRSPLPKTPALDPLRDTFPPWAETISLPQLPPLGELALPHVSGGVRDGNEENPEVIQAPAAFAPLEP
jgi:hypothetical protein